MDYYSKQISRLIEELSSLPGIGSKSAQRLAFHILNMPAERVEKLANTIVDARHNIRYCKTCCTLTDSEECPICRNPARNHRMIMVVENTRDLAAYEKTGKYDGVYHVLHGAISPMLGIGPGGLGGTTTALAVNINTYPTHIAGLPVAVNICCHVNRHIVRTI